MCLTVSHFEVFRCLPVVTCFVTLSTPVLVYGPLRIISKSEANILNDAELTALWDRTVSPNGTFITASFFTGETSSYGPRE